MNFIERLVYRYYHDASGRCLDWSWDQVMRLSPNALLDLGCGRGERIRIPEDCIYRGVDIIVTDEMKRAKLTVWDDDLNDFAAPRSRFDVVHTSQTIEHLHNTFGFISNCHNSLKPGGWLVLSTENIASLMNTIAVVCGQAPFSTMTVGNWFLGNKLSPHNNERIPDAGMNHLRVLSVAQLERLLQITGFINIEIKTIGLMPLPGWLGRRLEPHWRRGHFITCLAQKPL